MWYIIYFCLQFTWHRVVQLEMHSIKPPSEKGGYQKYNLAASLNLLTLKKITGTDYHFIIHATIIWQPTKLDNCNIEF